MYLLVFRQDVIKVKIWYKGPKSGLSRNKVVVGEPAAGEIKS